MDAEARADAVVAAVTVHGLPELPQALQLCLKRSMRQKAPKTAEARVAADALLLAEMKTKRDRELCAYQLFKWHEEQRQKIAQASKPS